ncbi:hypothetical protein [Streptomyces sp. NPDC055105]|uniref:hypothetical protein n=1 Tax=Streptomyces sp. NPDC055105 TaxID=3365719 RepID=UPI0037D2CDE7
MTGPRPSILTLIGPYKEPIAFAAKAEPAITASEFITQLGTAAANLRKAGIRNTENLDNAAFYLAQALDTTSREEVTSGIRHASHCLQATADLVGEYRPLVCD